MVLLDPAICAVVPDVGGLAPLKMWFGHLTRVLSKNLCQLG